MSALIAVLRGWWHRLRFLMLRRKGLAALEEELRFHAEMRAAEYRQSGMTVGAAARAAQRKVGDPVRWREETAAVLTFAWWETLAQDARFALRALRRGGIVTAAAVLSLALGIGSVLAIVTLVNVLLLRPVSYPDADRLAVAYQAVTPGFMSASDSMPLQLRRFARLQPLVPAFREAGFGTWDEVNLGADANAERIRIGLTTSGLFSVLAIAPALGRTPTVDEDMNGAAVVVLSDGFWRSRMSGKRDAIGSELTLAGTRFTVIGVMPREFRGLSDRSVLWVPVRSLAKLPPGSTVRFDDAESAIGTVIVRLPERVTIAEAAEQLTNGLASLPAPPLPPGRTMQPGLIAMSEAQQHPLVRSILLLLGVAVSAVLLIVCANVAGLLLARVRARGIELAIRSSLGAGRGRLMRLLIVEGNLLALLGGVPALLLGYGGARALAQMRPVLPDPFILLRGSDMLTGASLAPSAAILAFAVVLIAAVGTSIGLITAYAAPRRSLLAALKTHGGYTSTGRARGRALLVVTQVALATTLLVGAGLTLRSLSALMNAQLGYRTEHVLVAQLAGSYQVTPARRAELFARMSAIAGVDGVATAYSTPFMPEAIRMTMIDRVDGRALETRLPWFEGHQVSRGYFRVLDIPVRDGGDFAADAQPNGVLINETAARLLWPGQSAVGHSIGGGDDEPALVVIGVVGDARYQAVQTAASPALFQPIHDTASPAGVVTLFIRSERDPAQLLTSLRRELARVEPGTTLFDAGAMKQRVRTATGSTRYVTWLLLGFAGIAALLAAIGVYGVLAYGVTQRRRELGVRLALGAAPHSLVAGVVRQGAMLVGSGIALGLIAALASARVLRAFLYEIGTYDPLTLVGAAAALGTIGLAAMLLPARRAGAVDPMTVLRE